MLNGTLKVDVGKSSVYIPPLSTISCPCPTAVRPFAGSALESGGVPVLGANA